MGALDDLTAAGLPVPAIYSSETAAADKAYQDALASIASQQAQAAQRFGFKMRVDPNTGALLDTQIDPNQQFSSVMNLLTGHAHALRNLRESLTGQGLMGAGLKGLAAQRAALLRFQQQGQVAGLGQQFANQYGQLENQRAGARSTRDASYNQAANDALNFAISNGWFNTPAPQASAPSAPPGGGGGGSSGGGGGPAPNDTAGGTYPNLSNAVQNAANVQYAAQYGGASGGGLAGSLIGGGVSPLTFRPLPSPTASSSYGNVYQRSRQAI